MENTEIIYLLKTATYFKTIQVVKNKSTTTITDTVHNVVFSITWLPQYPKKFHCYFIDSNQKCWLTMGLNRLTLGGIDFDKSTLPADWDEDDLLIVNNNISIFTSQEDVLGRAMNYFSNYMDQFKPIEIETYFNLHKN